MRPGDPRPACAPPAGPAAPPPPAAPAEGRLREPSSGRGRSRRLDGKWGGARRRRGGSFLSSGRRGFLSSGAPAHTRSHAHTPAPAACPLGLSKSLLFTFAHFWAKREGKRAGSGVQGIDGRPFVGWFPRAPPRRVIREVTEGLMKVIEWVRGGRR